MLPVALAAAAVLVGVGVAAVRALYDRHVRVARAVSRGPRVSIRDAAEGQSVLVSGRILAPEQRLTSLFTGRRCVAYRVMVAGPTPRTRTDIIYEHGESLDFVIEDATGTAVVTTDGALLSLAKEQLSAEQLSGALATVPRDQIVDYGPDDLKCHEGLLRDGDRVFVRGVARWEADPAGTPSHYRESPKRLRLVAPVYISNRH